jgi:hypothetical protein
MEVSLNGSAGSKLVYTTDGSEPTSSSPLYSKPFVINKTSTIKAKLFAENDSSKTVTANFYKTPNNWKIKLNSKYNTQYSAGGDGGIIDGIYGDVNWRKGDWQGYQGQDFECTIDLNSNQKIKYISSNYLQDTRSWIVFPATVEYFTSTDGIKFTSIGKISNSVAAENYDVQLKKFEIDLPKSVNARYVKVIAKNFGKLPAWHMGAGGDAFIFTDEIEVK